jgi:hypothetical protein
MAPPDGAPGGALRWAGLLVAVWLATALAAAMPAWMLFHFAESRLPQAAGTALGTAAVIAVGGGLACARGRSRWSLIASALVVLLCLSAPVLLGLDGRTVSVTFPGRLLVGGAAAVLAGLAGVLTAIASRSVPPTAA